MEGATEIKCSQFGDNVIEHMWSRSLLPPRMTRLRKATAWQAKH